VRIDLVVYDFDGVMTDNRVLVFDDGHEAVFCNRDDGWAIRKISELKIEQIILTTEENKSVEHRAKKLNLPIISGCLTKREKLAKYCIDHNYDLRNVLYVGNGLNDLEVMKIVGYPIAVRDAHQKILEIASFVTKRKGGEGALLNVLWYIKENTSC